MKLQIFDSTLRDGAQGANISFSVDDKLKVIGALDALGVDFIEAGNPFSNPAEMQFFQRIRGKKLVLIDDSLVRGTQMRGTADFLYKSGAKELHIRLACPPILYGCPYLNFSRSDSDMELIARRKIAELEGTEEESAVRPYTDPDSPQYAAMVESIRKELLFTSLKYHRLDDMIASTGLPECKLCTYCWNGKK